MRKNMSWSWERLSHQGTSAPSIGGLAWDSKPHVPWDEWLLVTNKSSFGKPQTFNTHESGPQPVKTERCAKNVFCVVFIFLLVVEHSGLTFLFSLWDLRQCTNSCSWMLGVKGLVIVIPTVNPQKVANPHCLFWTWAFFPFANQWFLTVVDIFFSHT